MSKVKCPICQNADAEVKTTKQKEGALRKVKPKAFLSCPDCGSLFSNKVNFSNRISAMLANAQAGAEKAALSDNDSDKSENLSDNGGQVPPKSGGFFNNWGTVL